MISREELLGIYGLNREEFAKAEKRMEELGKVMFGEEAFKGASRTNSIDDLAAELGKEVLIGRVVSATLELPNGIQAKICMKGVTVSMKRTVKVVDENSV